MRLVGAIAAPCMLVAAVPPTATAAVSPGWVCTNDSAPYSGNAGADANRIKAIRPTASYSADDTLTLTFGAPVAAGATVTRRNADGTARRWRSGCPATGFVDAAASPGVTTQYTLTAFDREPATITVGQAIETAPGERHLVLVMPANLSADVRWALDEIYEPAVTAAGWTVVREVIAAGASPEEVRARLAARVAAEPRTRAALLLGDVPVVLSGSASGAGARPTDAFYADVDGTWTDSSVNTPTPRDPNRRNVPGDGRFDQEAPPSALELAVGRVDFRDLDGVRRGDTRLIADEEMAGYLIRAAERRRSYGERRRGSFVIEAAGVGAAGAQAWNAASALVPAAAGTRAELDNLQGVSDDIPSRRLDGVFRVGAATATSVGTWGPAQADDIVSPTNLGHGRFLSTPGDGPAQWHHPDSAVRAGLSGWVGADASATGVLNMDELALGKPIGESHAAAMNSSAWRGDRLASLMGDPTLTLEPSGEIQEASVRILPGCQNVQLQWQLAGLDDTATPIATLYRSVDGGPYAKADTARMEWSTSLGVHAAEWIDTTALGALSGKAVRYQVRVATDYVTGRGSFRVEAPATTLRPIEMRCAWGCQRAVSGANTQTPVETSRSNQLETTTTFTPDGSHATIALDRPVTGRSVTVTHSADQDEVAMDDTCADDEAPSTFTTSRLAPGVIHEFALSTPRAAGPGSANQPTPLLIAHELPARRDRGIVLVVIERSMHRSSLVQPRLLEWVTALTADGYRPIATVVNASDPVASVRAKIRELHGRAPNDTHTLVLIGHVPVPRSGAGAHDGHHRETNGAWATDAPYADVDGTWTDTEVNLPSTLLPQNRNVPGDGKFDQERMPSRAELAVGRIDLSDLPALGRSEAQLTADYLARSVQFRRGLLPHQARAYTRDNFGFVPAGHLSQVTPVVGAANVEVDLPLDAARVSSAAAGPYLLAYGAGSGMYTSAQGVGTTTDPAPALFLGAFGSYFGNWDTTDNFLRGHLARNLGAMWQHWSVDGLALGESTGEAAQRALNRERTGRTFALSSYLGDPTLRMYPMRNVTGASAAADSTCETVSLRWTASTDSAVDGYLVERYAGTGWVPLTAAPLPASSTEWTDGSAPIAGTSTRYRVRPVRMQHTSRGSFTNLGQGTSFAAPPCEEAGSADS